MPISAPPSSASDTERLLIQAQGLVAQTGDRVRSNTTSGALLSGVMQGTMIVLYGGTTATTGWFALQNAAVAPTHGFLALYDAAFSLKAVTADTTAAYTATGVRSIAFTTPFPVPATAVYYMASLCTAGTGPDMVMFLNSGATYGSIAGGARPTWQAGGLSSPPATATPVDTGAEIWFAVT